MAVRVFCDICNTEITDEKENFAVVSVFSRQYNILKGNIKEGVVEEKYQLCPNCSQELSRFLKSQKDKYKKVEEKKEK